MAFLKIIFWYSNLDSVWFRIICRKPRCQSSNLLPCALVSEWILSEVKSFLKQKQIEQQQKKKKKKTIRPGLSTKCTVDIAHCNHYYNIYHTIQCSGVIIAFRTSNNKDNLLSDLICFTVDNHSNIFITPGVISRIIKSLHPKKTTVSDQIPVVVPELCPKLFICYLKDFFWWKSQMYVLFSSERLSFSLYRAINLLSDINNSLKL